MYIKFCDYVLMIIKTCCSQLGARALLELTEKLVHCIHFAIVMHVGAYIAYSSILFYVIP